MKIIECLKTIKKNKYVLTILKSLAALTLLTAVCAISVHYLTGDTLSEYATKNPELAYGTTTTNDNTIESTENNTVNINEDNTDNMKETEISANETTVENLNVSNLIHFYDPSNTSTERITYQEGFYYEPLSDEMVEYITGKSFPENLDTPAISTDELRYVGIKYIDFNGLIQAGELICNQKIAEDLVEIFFELYSAEYQLERVVLIDNYGGDDLASMCADNTSCFNYRVVANTSSLSNHAYGLAIDINPFYNPYIVFGGNDDGSDYISPPGSEAYVDRSTSFAYKIDENDFCYKQFIQHGFTWGGNWNSSKDYQHFQKK